MAAILAICCLPGWSSKNEPKENKVFDRDVIIHVVLASTGAKKDVNMKGLPAFESNGRLAVRLYRIVLKAALPGFRPRKHKYAFNFISNDADGNWNLLSHLAGVSELPVWNDKISFKDMRHGWIEDAGDNGYQLFWAEESGFSKRKKVKHMDGGAIVVLETGGSSKSRKPPP